MTVLSKSAGRRGHKPWRPGTPRPNPAARRRRRREWLSGYLFLAPAVVFLALLIIYPLGKAVQYSLQRWDGIGPATYVGLANYTQIFTDPVERGSLANLGILLIFYALVPTALALAVVSMVRRVQVRGMGFFRVVFFLPQVIVTVVVAIVWTWLMAPSGTGTINRSCTRSGSGPATGTPWLGSFGTALPAVGLIAAWLDFGLCFVLLLPGIQRIPPEIFDAARVDGAGLFREFFRITVPMMRRDIGAAITITRCRGAAELHADLPGHQRRSRLRHDGARPAHLSRRVPARRRRLGERPRHRHDGDHLRPDVRYQGPDRAKGDRDAVAH